MISQIYKNSYRKKQYFYFYTFVIGIVKIELDKLRKNQKQSKIVWEIIFKYCVKDQIMNQSNRAALTKLISLYTKNEEGIII